MDCYEFGFTIINDSNDKLANSVMNVAGANKLKARVLAGYVNSQEFLDYCKRNKKFDASKSLAENNQNTIRSLLRHYFREKHKSVIESAAKKQAEELQGFSSVNAKSLALDYTATMIGISYNQERKNSKDKEVKLDRKKVINSTLYDMENSYFDDCVIPLYLSLRDKMTSLFDERLDAFKEAQNEVSDITEKLNELKKDSKNNAEAIKELRDKLAEARRVRYNLAYALVSESGTTIQKNYANMIEQAKRNPNEWFTKAFESSKLISIVNEFKNVLESDKLIDENFQDENDAVNPNAESVDETSKSWEDKIWASFDKAVAADLKLYFNSLFKFAAPSELGSKKYTYDTNNELGVPTTMGANFVIVQLLNRGNYNSVNDFIDSIVNMSQQVPELYGFVVIADRAIKDPVFANYLFTQLCNPKITKTMAILTENGIDFTQSNKSADALSYVVYNMMNATRSTMTDVFTTIDIDKIAALKEKIRLRNNAFFSAKYTKEKQKQEFEKYKANIEDTIYSILKKYYPNLTIVALRGYLYRDPANIKDNISALVDNIEYFLKNVDKVIQKYNEADYEFSQAYHKWANHRDAVLESGQGEVGPAPVRDLSDVNYDSLNDPIISIAKKLVNYMAVKNELNSTNAEGNLASDVIGNNWITNTIKQIAYGNKQDSEAGLHRLLEEVTKGEQYKYNSLYWGVKDSNGKYVSEGLFMKDDRGNITVNPNARKIIQVNLFNGVKDENNTNAVMYNRMSKGDYFLTNLYAYFNPINSGEHISTSSVDLAENYAGYFMRTPSDAPKNFIVQAPKLNAKNILVPVASSVTKYLTSVQDKVNGFITEDEKYKNEYSNYVLDNSKITKKQVWKAKDIYKLFTGEIDNFVYNNMYSIQNEDGSVTVPVVYRSKEALDIVWIRGQRVQGETNHILYDIQIENITTSDNKAMSADFFADIADTIKTEGIANGQIETVVNKDVAIFSGVRQNLIGELNTYIDQLNNIFEKDKAGNWILKTDMTGLIDRAHYNETIAKDGRLTGNFFSFKKLFETNGVDVQKMIEEQLSLYGGGNKGLIHLTEKSGSLNMNHELISEENGRLVLNLTKEINQILDSITSEWIKGFNREVVSRTQQYDKLTKERFDSEQIFDCMINTAVAEMAFDDLFEGDVKFYKNAQDFLKRAKEVQAAGKAYAGFDLNDSLSQKIKDCIDRNGNVQPIKVAGVTLDEFLSTYSPVEGTSTNYVTSPNARNGFRAATIHNTVRPSKYADRIRKEVFDILKNKMSEVEATKIAQEIYKGFADNTKTNDAQSYITLEEFIRRRWADGTLDQYQDILSQLYAVRKGELSIKDIDISKINARIQVQKNFYFDKMFDTATRTFYPRQIKNAEFVLIPELLEGTELKELYDVMVKHDIGQVNTVETSKAAKKNILTFWDNEGNINPNFEAELTANGEAAIEDYYYRFLYKQQEVPEHMKDEYNKAGIQIMKKIIDNADESVAPYIKDFFDNYCANIKEDFNRMIYSMGWKINKDGSISNIDSNSEILDFTEFYSKARHEAQRLGLDENFIEYLTPDELGNPVMPNYMNNVSSKLESIAQAIFNSNITRQKLPGWHAAQVTQIGHGMKVLDNTGKLKELKYHPALVVNKETGEQIEEEIYNSLSEEEQAKYDVKQEAYAEVMLPRWSNLIPQTEDAIEMIQKGGLDIQIAYRIPTEGKQSVSIVKVVGFLDDVYGSTIMLPDEWVTQTGADFDVDSVYGVCHEMYTIKDKDKNVIGLKKWDKAAAGSDLGMYKKYLYENIENKIPSDIDDSLKPNKYKQLKDRLKVATKNRDYAEINRIGKEAGLMTFNEFKALPEVEKLPRQVRNNNILDAMIKIMESVNSREENYSRSNFDDVVSGMKEMNDARGESKLVRSTYNPLDQIDFMENAMGGASLKAFSVTRDTFNSVNNAAKSYLSKSHHIVSVYDLTQVDEDGKKIYNFETIVDAYGCYNLGQGQDVIAYNANNEVITRKDGEQDKEFKERLKQETTKVRVKHYRLANSNNGRNVVGKLVTVYSSETTAHILDAIKEGAIYNENTYTFGTFKTLIDTGIDYRTAIAFLMQPAVTMINEVNNETNSIYANSGTSVIKTAIKRIAANAGFTIGGKPITDYTNFDAVMGVLNNDPRFKKAVFELFGANISNEKSIANVVFDLDVVRLKNRLKQEEITNNSELSQEDKAIRDAAFDIAMAFTFDKIRNTTQSIEKIMRCSNPDKFGAKQTIRATRMIVDNIKEFGFNYDNPVTNTILVENTSLLEAIYPGFNTEAGVQVDKSVYKYLAAFLKFATIPSVDINSKLFPTENKVYNDITNAIQIKLGTIFTDEQYKEYKQYMMSYIYSCVPYINTPLTITEEGWFDIDDEAIKRITKNDKQYWNQEVSRIFGYEETQSVNIDVKDVYNPTKEEIDAFNKLTPAQKVLWVQINFTDDAGIFGYLNVNKYNQWEVKHKGYTQQTIRFADGVDNMQEVYRAFNSSFYNTSPFVRLAAMDLIKYAFIVEGFKFKKGGLSKIITNNAMYKNIEDMGMNLIPVIREVFRNYSSPASNATTKFIDKFVRSHSEYTKTLNLGKAENKNGNPNLAFKFNTYGQGDGLVYVPYDKSAEELLEAINTRNDVTSQDYIRINRRIGKNNTITTLYKIVNKRLGIYLIPLNLLERNETGDYSVNPKNNRYKNIQYYETIINEAEDRQLTVKRIKDNKVQFADVISELDKDSVVPRFQFDTVKESIENPDEFRRILINGTERERSQMGMFIKHVADYVNSPVEMQGKYAVVRSDSKFITSLIPKGINIIQNVPIGDNIVSISISQTQLPRPYKNSIATRKKLNVDTLPIEERTAYEDAFHAHAPNSTYFKIKLVIDESVKEQVEKQTKENTDKIAPDMAAITSDATDFYVREQDKFDAVDTTAKYMMEALRRSERQGDTDAAKARRALELKNINEFRSEDIANNRKNIYSIAAQYIESYADALDKLIHHYRIGDKEYNIGEDDLYEALREHPEEVEHIVKLLLEGITFGGSFGDIMTLPFEGLDEETTNAIKKIRNNITRIRNNTAIKQGFDKMFNNYIANEYSTNPNVRLGLVNLKDTFGDAGWWESWIGDIHAISNKQIQTVVKIVDNIMTQAAIEDAPKRKREFLNRLDGILEKPGEFSWDHVVDKEGKLVQPYTSKFIEDRNRLSDAVKQAKEEYGIDSIEYIKAKLERDEWRAKNVHQIVIPEYYIEKNANVRKVLEEAPQEYLEYMKLIHELYGDSRESGVLTKEERDRRKEINKKINRLKSFYKEDGTRKSEEECIRVKVLKEFIENKRTVESKYFEWHEAYDFKEALEKNIKIVEQYEAAHAGETLDVRLQNEEYRNAYEWIQDNSDYLIDEATQQKINKAFETLKDEDNTNSDKIKEIIAFADAYDEFGNIDPRKLSDEDIAEIKRLTKHKFDFSYDSSIGEAILIKDIPAGLPIFKDEFYQLFRDSSENSQFVNKERLAVIGRINEILSKIVTPNGRIQAKDVFEKLTEDERNELAEAYRRLRGIKGKRKSKEVYKRIKNNVENAVNNTAFNEQLVWALSNLKGTSNFDVFLDIFVQTDSAGEYQLDEKGNYIPNNDIYGYIVPKDDTYIDVEKTEARKLIEENLEFVPTEYYYDALRKATENGEFKEWYEKNHVYNPYKHKFEPLRVWTTMKVNPNGSLKGTYTYVPTFENQEKTVKESLVNTEYRTSGSNYNSDTGQYNKITSLTSKEQEVHQLLQEAMSFFAKYNNSNPFIEQGFVPRKRKVEPDAKWYGKQAIGMLGLEWRNDSEDRWFEKVDYVNDRDVDNNMLHWLKGKGYRELEKVRPMGINESPEKYQEYLEAVKKRNEEIKAKNLEIDNALMDRDYRTVFAEAIQQQVINNARSKAKNWLYLLQEDLKQNDAYAISSLSGKPITDKKGSTDVNEKFVTTKQNNALAMVEAFTRRVIYDQFKKRTPYNKYADLARNITSAKYMIFNLTGGIANVGTGFVNIMGEAFAEDNITKADLRNAVAMYMSNSVSMIADMYKETSNNFAVALTKYFNAVDFDAMTERVAGETAGEHIRRMRNLLYSMQSGGEHFMQNSVLFAVLKQSKIFDDIDGTTRCGTLQQYIWKTEHDTLVSIIQNDEVLMDDFREMKRQIKTDKKEAHKYDTFKHNLVEDFLRAHCNEKQINEYVTKRNEAIKRAKEEWKTKKSAIDMLELGKDGIIHIKAGEALTQDMVNELRNTTIALNKKIHGVYDKIGAARIEFYWWGGLVMQYHKHIYPGIMKRFRRKGYYNEQTNTVEMGSYTSLVRLLGKEFDGIDKRISNRKDNGENAAIASIREVAKATLDGILNIKTNWKLMPEWERNSCKRVLGDLYGITSAILMAMAIYAFTDDDDEKESEVIATALYISDRLLAEAQMYTPWGLISEGKTLWSSPIAATNGPEDLLKGLGFLSQWMLDPDFNPTYKTGLYKGQNKGWLLLKRNIPLYRVIDRLSHMTKNNSYYRINQKALNMRIAKAIADEVNPD